MVMEGEKKLTKSAARLHNTVSTVLALHSSFVLCQRSNPEDTEDYEPEWYLYISVSLPDNHKKELTHTFISKKSPSHPME